ncbi:MAG: WXG100 family type VII secretion target [Nocardioidaceae bacterium]|nr:WXG100 family type VII secretion target [Nocardioidaceae bacterium]MCL2613223.1 WXG100 family type VII secretion target [Nocardioidaceae bacterium]
MSGNLDELRVEHAGLDTAAQDMFDTVKKIDARLDQLEHELNPLQTQWEGNQREAYRVAKASWDWAMQEMRDLLDESHKTVYTSNADYMAADNRGASRFQF